MIHLPFRFDGKRHRVQDKIIEEAQVAKGIEEARHSGYVAGYVTGLKTAKEIYGVAPGGREEVDVDRAVSVQSASGSTRPPASVSQHEAVAVSATLATGDNRTKETGDGQTKETGTAGLTQSAARGTNEASTAKGGAGSAITAPARRNAVCLPNTKSRMLSGRGREWINFLALGDGDSDEPPTKILPRVSTLVLRRSGLMDGRRWVP